MRKFIVHTRPLPGCCKVGDAPTVIEVEGEMISATEDPSVKWLPEGEFRFRITKPDFLFEPKQAGSKEMVPPVYHSHAIYWNVYQARAVAERLVRQGFEFSKRKSGKEYSKEEVRAKYSEITEIIL